MYLPWQLHTNSNPNTNSNTNISRGRYEELREVCPKGGAAGAGGSEDYSDRRRSARRARGGGRLRLSEAAKAEQLFTYSTSPVDTVTLVRGDMERCAEGEFLNDSLVDFFVKYLFREKLARQACWL